MFSISPKRVVRKLGFTRFNAGFLVDPVSYLRLTRCSPWWHLRPVWRATITFFPTDVVLLERELCPRRPGSTLLDMLAEYGNDDALRQVRLNRLNALRSC